MEKLYKQLKKYYTSSTIMLLLNDAIFYSARTKDHNVLQIIITKLDSIDYKLEQKMMCGYKMQRNVAIVDESDIIQHISSLSNYMC